MDISEMHVWFRQYAQQMGMQNVRAILPEQIDLLINTSIDDIVKNIIAENISNTNDRVVTDNSKLGQINSLRTLYDVVRVEGSNVELRQYVNKPFKINLNDAIYNFLHLIDFSISYEVTDSKGDNPQITDLFPVRLIDRAYLSDTLQDFVLAPKLRTPIAVVYNANVVEERDKDGNHLMDFYDYKVNPVYYGGDEQRFPKEGDVIYEDENVIKIFKRHTYIDVYLGKNELHSDLLDRMYIKEFECSIIRKPAKVKYISDLGQTNVNCDLPESLHYEILKHAVDLYRISIAGSIAAAQQQEQNQARENIRNNIRQEQ